MKKYTGKKVVTTTSTKNFYLDGNHTLLAEEVKTTSEIIHELHPTTKKPVKQLSRRELNVEVKPIRFELVEVTAEEVSIHRQNGVPGFVLKDNGKLFFTQIPETMTFLSSNLLCPHKCAVAGKECRRLSAASDADGGCEKVRNHATYIERYPWITRGFESFNTKLDSFVVSTCEHYEKCPPRTNKHSMQEVNDLKLGIAQYIWEDVRTLPEARARRARSLNLSSNYN